MTSAVVWSISLIQNRQANEQFANFSHAIVFRFRFAFVGTSVAPVGYLATFAFVSAINLFACRVKIAWISAECRLVSPFSLPFSFVSTFYAWILIYTNDELLVDRLLVCLSVCLKDTKTNRQTDRHDDNISSAFSLPTSAFQFSAFLSWRRKIRFSFALGSKIKVCLHKLWHLIATNKLIWFVSSIITTKFQTFSPTFCFHTCN